MQNTNRLEARIEKHCHGAIRAILREHVASLVSAPDQIDEEIRHLMNAVTM